MVLLCTDVRTPIRVSSHVCRMLIPIQSITSTRAPSICPTISPNDIMIFFQQWLSNSSKSPPHLLTNFDYVTDYQRFIFKIGVNQMSFFRFVLIQMGLWVCISGASAQACTYNYSTGTMDCGTTHTYSSTPLYSDQELYSNGSSTGSVLYSQEEADNFSTGGMLGSARSSGISSSSSCSGLIC